MRVTIVATLIASVALPSWADDTTTLLTHKAWTVEHNYDAETARQYCLAGTWSRAGTSFDIVAFDSGDLFVAMFNSGWRMPPSQSRFIIADVDYERWSGNGEVTEGGQAIMVRMGSADTAVEFLADVRKGSAVAVYNEDMRRIETFSLAGSAAGIAKLVECWARIYAPVDPDPFVGTSGSDPFL